MTCLFWVKLLKLLNVSSSYVRLSFLCTLPFLSLAERSVHGVQLKGASFWLRPSGPTVSAALWQTGPWDAGHTQGSVRRGEKPWGEGKNSEDREREGRGVKEVVCGKRQWEDDVGTQMSYSSMQVWFCIYLKNRQFAVYNCDICSWNDCMCLDNIIQPQTQEVLWYN